MYDLLARAASNREGRLHLPAEMGTGPEVANVVDFLAEQGWLEKDCDDGTWTLTPPGRFWLESLEYGDIVKFYDYGGAVFLLHTRSGGRETVVWQKGKFATIGIAYSPYPGHLEVRKENEGITTSGGSHMRDALTAACALVAEDLDLPQLPQLPGPEELRLHMLNYMKQL